MATNTFKRKFSTNIGTTATAVGGYQVLLDIQTTAIGLALANVTASQITVSVTLNTQAGDTIHIIKDAPIPSGGALIPLVEIKRLLWNITIRLKSCRIQHRQSMQSLYS